MELLRATFLGSVLLMGLSVSSVFGVLNYKFHGQFEHTWNDIGTGAARDVSFWKPFNVSSGYNILGHLALSTHRFDYSSYTVVVQGTGDELAVPISMTWIYDDYKTGADRPVSIHKPNPPPGYVCLGMVAFARQGDANVADFPDVRCVKEELVTTGKTRDEVWNDKKSGGKHDCSVWSIQTADPATQLTPGLFFAHRSYDRPADNVHHVLKASTLGPHTSFGDQASRLLKSHAPNIYFHPNEQYFPDDAKHIFQTSLFLYGNANTDFHNYIREVKGGFQMTATTTNADLVAKASGSPLHWLQIPSSTFGGNVARTKAYVDVYPRSSETIDYVFWIFWPYNGPGYFKAGCGILGFMDKRLDRAASHEGDWEHFTIRLKFPARAHEPVLVENYYLSRHGAGSWTGPRLESDTDGRPAIYSSLNSHALYDRSGDNQYCRPKSINAGVCTFFVDLVDQTGRGQKLITSNVLTVASIVNTTYSALAGSSMVDYVRATEEDWYKYERRWGDYIKQEETVKFLGFIPAYTYKEVSAGPHGPKTKGLHKAPEVDEAVPCEE